MTAPPVTKPSPASPAPHAAATSARPPQTEALWPVAAVLALLSAATGVLLSLRRRRYPPTLASEESEPEPPAAATEGAETSGQVPEPADEAILALPPLGRQPQRPQAPPPPQRWQPAPLSAADPAEPEQQPAPRSRPAPGQFVPAQIPGARITRPSTPVPLIVELTPERLTISLVMATLRYRLRLANPGESRFGEVVVRGDMIAAHASVPESQQLSLEGVELPVCHRLDGLAPGESAELSGEVRVNLANLTPIRVGNAALLVPLLRFRTVATGDTPASQTTVLAVGEPPAAAGAGIRPFRLDLGPRLYANIAARKLEPGA